jgi:shikimate dehydrogenase
LLLKQKIIRNRFLSLPHTPQYALTLINHDYPAKTAQMWNATYRAFGIDARMGVAVVHESELPTIIEALRADARYIGGGVGAGCKERIGPLLDTRTPRAQAIGAVNIVKREQNGTLIGDTTDGVGFTEALAKELGTLDEVPILILGAGGTARSIAFALAEAGALITILNRTEAKARSLAENINSFSEKVVASAGGFDKKEQALTNAVAVVSTVDDAISDLDAYAPLGDMEVPVTPNSIALNQESTKKLLMNAPHLKVVADIRLRNETTPLLTYAGAQGLRTLDGVPMVIGQGARAFWWLHGEELEHKGIDQDAVYACMEQAAH